MPSSNLLMVPMCAPCSTGHRLLSRCAVDDHAFLYIILILSQHLECSLELQVLQDCKFTNLRRLKLRLLSGASVSIDRSRIQFLANNPSIEELAWIPLGCIQMPPNILPNLRSVQTTVEVLRSLCKSEAPRAFEVLEVLSLDAETLIGMENLDRGALKKLTLSWFDNMGQLERIAELFPNLTWLNLPRSGTATTPVSEVNPQ